MTPTRSAFLAVLDEDPGGIPVRIAGARLLPRRTPGSVPGDIKLNLATGGHRNIGHPQAFRLSHLGAQHHGEQR